MHRYADYEINIPKHRKRCIIRPSEKAINTNNANMSKHVGEKCGKLCICNNSKFKRGITPAKIDIN